MNGRLIRPAAGSPASILVSRFAASLAITVVGAFLVTACLATLQGPALAGPVAAPSGCCLEAISQAYPPSITELGPQLKGCSSAPCPDIARAARLFEEGEIDKAKAVLDKARAGDSRSPFPSYYLGEIALRTGDVAGAIEALSTAVRINPNLAGSHALLGQARIASGAVAQGLTALRTAIALAPGGSRGHLDLGRAYLDTGQPEHALVELERALEIDAAVLEARYLLARAQMNAGNLEAGCASLQSYVREARQVPEENARVVRAEEILRTFAKTG